jgi:hypothetical protein
MPELETDRRSSGEIEGDFWRIEKTNVAVPDPGPIHG